jgi:hypothetical protein
MDFGENEGGLMADGWVRGGCASSLVQMQRIVVETSV